MTAIFSSNFDLFFAVTERGGRGERTAEDEQKLEAFYNLTVNREQNYHKVLSQLLFRRLHQGERWGEGKWRRQQRATINNQYIIGQLPAIVYYCLIHDPCMDR
jgi:hypothetical protein